jgi:hypothetical protein
MYFDDPNIAAWSQISHPAVLPPHKFTMGTTASVATGGEFVFKGVKEVGRTSREDRQVVRHMLSFGWVAVPAGMPTHGLPIRRWTDDRPEAPDGYKLIQIDAGMVTQDPGVPSDHLPEVYRLKPTWYPSGEAWQAQVDRRKADALRDLSEVMAAVAAYTKANAPAVVVAPVTSPALAEPCKQAEPANVVSPVVFPSEWTRKRGGR